LIPFPGFDSLKWLGIALAVIISRKYEEVVPITKPIDQIGDGPHTATAFRARKIEITDYEDFLSY
jgi:hypothetical protein